MDDAKVLWDFFNIIKKDFSAKRTQNALNLVLKKPSLPLNLSAEIIDSLPEAPGVYIFYGKKDTLLYIGKSVNIKERVMSHFSQDYSSSFEMNIAQEIERIELILTSGELGALFKESSLIKKLQPIYNRKLNY